MSVFCPIIKHKVTYLDYKECEDRECEKQKNTEEDKEEASD